MPYRIILTSTLPEMKQFFESKIAHFCSFKNSKYAVLDSNSICLSNKRVSGYGTRDLMVDRDDIT